MRILFYKGVVGGWGSTELAIPSGADEVLITYASQLQAAGHRAFVLQAIAEDGQVQGLVATTVMGG